MVSYTKGGTLVKGFENIILRRILGLERDEDGEWRILKNEAVYSSYHSPNMARVIKFKT